MNENKREIQHKKSNSFSHKIQKMFYYVKSLVPINGKRSHGIDIEGYNTIYDIRLKLAQLFSVDVNNIVLILAGRPVDDAQTVDDLKLFYHQGLTVLIR